MIAKESERYIDIYRELKNVNTVILTFIVVVIPLFIVGLMYINQNPYVVITPAIIGGFFLLYSRDVEIKKLREFRFKNPDICYDLVQYEKRVKTIHREKTTGTECQTEIVSVEKIYKQLKPYLDANKVNHKYDVSNGMITTYLNKEGLVKIDSYCLLQDSDTTTADDYYKHVNDMLAMMLETHNLYYATDIPCH